MKVAHIISTFPPYKGGMGNSVYHAALAIAKRGHQSVVFTPAYDPAVAREEVLGENTTVVRLTPLFAFGNAAILPQLLWRLREFDIIHLHYPFYGSGSLAAIASLFFKGKLVMHYHMDTVGHGFKGLLFWLNNFFVLPLIVRAASVVSCASYDYIKHSQLSSYYSTHEKSFMEIPFGVELKSFYPAKTEREPIVLFVGGLDSAHYFKGVTQLIGRGNLENYYHRLAFKQGVGEKVVIDNDADDLKLAEWYRQARVSVLPSINKSEAFGLVLLEAMASGTPVIASNLPGVRNVFRNHEHGFLVKPGDVQVLAEKIAYCLENREAAAVMGSAARQWIEEHYSWEQVGQRLEAAYFRVLYGLPKIS